MKLKLGIHCALVGLSVASSKSSLAQTADRAPKLEVRSAEPATVTVWNRPVVVLRASIGGVSPGARAERIAPRLEKLSRGAQIRWEPAAVGGLVGISILGDGRMLFGLVPEDLDPESDERLEDVAASAVSKIQEALELRERARRPETLLKGSAFTLGGLVLLLIFVRGVLRVRRIVMELGPPPYLQDLRVYGFEVTPALSYLGKRTIQIFSLGLVVFAIYLFVAFALSEFPYSQPWGEGLGRFLLNRLTGLALGALGALPGLFTVAVIFFVGRMISRMITEFFDRVEKGESQIQWFEVDTARATRQLLVTLNWIFVFTAAYPYIPGSRTEAFRAIGVFVGLMATLGGAGFANQIMSGLVVIYSRSLRVGDYVRVGDTEGVVSDVGTLSTKIVTRAREEITMPNAVLVGSAVTNFSKLAGEEGAVVKTTVTIGYDAPWRQVHALLERAADSTEGVRKIPRPVVLQRALSDFYVEYQLLVHIERIQERIAVLSELHAQIQDAFNEFGVQIMSPHFEGQPPQKVFVPKQAWKPAPASESAD